MTNRKLAINILILFIVGLVPVSLCAQGSDPARLFIVVDFDEIFRKNGTNSHENISNNINSTYLNNIGPIAVDVARKKIIWSFQSGAGEEIARADFDGNNSEVLVTNISSPVTRIVVAQAAGKLFFVSGSSIMEANLLSTGTPTTIRSSSYSELMYDAQLNAIYYLDLGAGIYPDLWRRLLSNGTETLVRTMSRNISSIRNEDSVEPFMAIDDDQINGDGSNDFVEFTNLSTSSPIKLTTFKDTMDIALAPSDNGVYAIVDNGSKIERVHEVDGKSTFLATSDVVGALAFTAIDFYNPCSSCDDDGDEDGGGSGNDGCTDTHLDSDNDGTNDCDDVCPNDANNDKTDADGDGVFSCSGTLDKCDTDPIKTNPGICGCGILDLDADYDGVPFCVGFSDSQQLDQCPDDYHKTKVDLTTGCDCNIPNSSFPDCTDECPTTPKAEKGVCGCDTPDTDTDQDGVPDCNDKCVNDPDKIVEGICGCGVTDDAAFNDCVDLCPDDPDKVLEGLCGCGIPDELYPGCELVDLCPDDPNKTEVGECGCGLDECTPCDADACPDDPDKCTAGVCGCGVPDNDTDGDGVLDCQDSCADDAFYEEESGVCPCGQYPDADGVCGDVPRLALDPDQIKNDLADDGKFDIINSTTGKTLVPNAFEKIKVPTKCNKGKKCKLSLTLPKYNIKVGSKVEAAKKKKNSKRSKSKYKFKYKVTLTKLGGKRSSSTSRITSRKKAAFSKLKPGSKYKATYKIVAVDSKGKVRGSSSSSSSITITSPLS